MIIIRIMSNNDTAASFHNYFFLAEPQSLQHDASCLLHVLAPLGPPCEVVILIVFIAAGQLIWAVLAGVWRGCIIVCGLLSQQV